MTPLRLYQNTAVTSVLNEWQSVQSTLLVMSVGTGKTVCFSEVIRRMQPKRALVLAHREELIWQAKNTIESRTGLECQIEMNTFRADMNVFSRAPVVLSTVQTQLSGKDQKRMQRFSPNDFGVVIIDESHRAVSRSFIDCLKHYQQNPDIKILGVTGSPDRLDQVALGKVFQSVAFEYQLPNAIDDGFLVPVEQQMIRVKGLDFSGIKTTCGDLNGKDLAAVMEDEKRLHGVAHPTLEIIGDRRTLVFASSVRHAELLCDIFNRHKTGISAWACGATPPQDRRLILKDFASGKIQILVNCDLLVEGYDNPGVQVVAQARPTKSRARYTQQIGRCTRPLPGVIDGLTSAFERKEAIASSSKPHCTVLDFSGNSGRHKLVTTADILGGDYSDEAVESARKKAEASDKAVNIRELLEESEEEIRKRMEAAKAAEAARKAKIIAKATYSVKIVDPFDAFGLRPVKNRGWDEGKPVTEKMANVLVKMGVQNPYALPYAQARQLLNEQFRRWNQNLCTAKQAAFLKKRGYDTKEMTMKEASAIMNELSIKEGWKKKEAA